MQAHSSPVAVVMSNVVSFLDPWVHGIYHTHSFILVRKDQKYFTASWDGRECIFTALNHVN